MTQEQELIRREVKQKNMPILCLDFDGVLHSYSSGWKGADVIPDPPTFGAMKFLSEAVKHFRIAVYSSRSGQPGGIDAMRIALRLWLTNELEGAEAEHVYSLIEWPTEKPPAFVGIDDRVITFGGTWPNMDALKAFKPWNKGGETQLIFRGELEQVRAENAALRSQLEKAREVKPLEWKPTHIKGEHLRDTARDMDGRLRYEVGVVPGNHYLIINRPEIAGGLESHGPYPSEDEAKTHAQADYQRRYNAMSQEGE